MTRFKGGDGPLAVALLIIAAQGCALSRVGRHEVSTRIDLYDRLLAETGNLYARTPPPEGTTQDPPLLESQTIDQLRDYIVFALERNPEIKAAEETARSKAERIVQVTALSDPMVTTRTLPEPIRTAEGDNFFVLGISERFPVPEKLDRAGRIALEETRAALHRLQEVRLRIIAEVKRAYFQLYVLDKSIEITQDNQRLLRGLIDVARAQVAAGRRPQDDVLRAQVELSNLEAELISLRTHRVSNAWRINQLLDRPVGTPVPPPRDFDVRQAVFSLDRLLAKAIGANPALGRLRHQIQRDEHAIELAKLAYWPEFTLGLEWMYMRPRDAFRPPPNPMTGQRPVVSTMSEEGTDNWAVTFGFTLPIWFEKIQGGIDEARHRLASTRHEFRAARNQIEFQINDARERVLARRELATLFESTIIPQAQQTYQVSRTSYAAGEGDFLYVIDNWRKWLVFTIQYHRSLGELEQSVADLEQAIGLSLSELDGP